MLRFEKREKRTKPTSVLQTYRVAPRFVVVDKVSDQDKRRNVLGKSYVYTKSSPYTFRSFYGDFVCNVSTVNIDL